MFPFVFYFVVLSMLALLLMEKLDTVENKILQAKESGIIFVLIHLNIFKRINLILTCMSKGFIM